MHCLCPSEGYCPRFNRHIWNKSFDMCRSVDCDLGDAAALRQFWRRDAEERGVKCACPTDGFCDRFGRYMYGRDRAICQGENVDLGTAEMLRDQWARDQRRVCIKTDQAPGDAMAVTAAIYSLHKQYPGKFVTSVETPYPEVFQYNPHVVPTCGAATPLHMHYPAVHDANRRGITFLQACAEFLGEALGAPLRLQTNRPHLYFPPDVRHEVSSYWVVCSGTKNDLTAKRWGHQKYQEVVDATGLEFVQVGAAHHDHVPLRGTRNLVGQTSLRQLFEVIRGSRGVLCGVSLPMHIAAALEKPCVVVAGGREPATWNAYPMQQYIHSVGSLPCCPVPCWRMKVTADESNHPELTVCDRPVGNVPECMDRITSAEVAATVLRLDSSFPRSPVPASP